MTFSSADLSHQWFFTLVFCHFGFSILQFVNNQERETDINSAAHYLRSRLSASVLFIWEDVKATQEKNLRSLIKESNLWTSDH